MIKREVDREKIKEIIKKSPQYNILNECDTIQIGETFIDIEGGDNLLETLADIYEKQINAQHNAEKSEKGASVIEENTHPDFQKEINELLDIEKDKDLS